MFSTIPRIVRPLIRTLEEIAAYRVARRLLFWSKVSVQRADDCWLWNGVITNTGYGRFAFDGHYILAHRFSYWDNVDRHFADNLFVLHRCDVPRCVNFLHLFAGTRSDNANDAIGKGRQWGRKVKIPLEQRELIRRGIKSGEVEPIEMMIKYDVSHETIRRILHEPSISLLTD